MATPKKGSPKWWRNKCDDLWKLIVKRDRKCERCGRTDRQLHAHHLMTRAKIFFRHNLNNGICLCSRCHTFDVDISAHEAPWAFETWMMNHREDQYKWWVENRYKVIKGRKIDYEQVYDMLKVQSKELGI